MTTPNHLAGGVAFTSVFASLWSVNIFSSPVLLGGTLFFSLLADVDHQRSVMGKLFRPLSRYLDRNYGHRTITHSLIALVAVWAAVKLVVWLVFARIAVGFWPLAVSEESAVFSLPLVTVLAYASHLIFDMMTLQGVPLFYPFNRKACVIPGDPKMRIRTNDVRTGAVFFTLFCMVTLICMPLIRNGFWTSYNRAFGTQKHVAREFSNTDKWVEVDYEFLREGRLHRGSGKCLYADWNRTVLFTDSAEVLDLNREDAMTVVKAVRPLPTTHLREQGEVYLDGVSIDSLNRFFYDKVILNAELRSNGILSYYGMSDLPGRRLDLSYADGRGIMFGCEVEDENGGRKTVDGGRGNSGNSRLSTLEMQLATKEARLSSQRVKYGEELAEKRLLLNRVEILRGSYSSSPIYEQELLQKQIKEAERKLNGLRVHPPDAGLMAEISQLRKIYFSLVKERDSTVLASGNLVLDRGGCLVYGRVSFVFKSDLDRSVFASN